MEDSRTVICIYPDGSKKTLPILEGVIEEAKGKCTIQGGRPPFEEPVPVVKEVKTKTKKSEGDK